MHHWASSVVTLYAIFPIADPQRPSRRPRPLPGTGRDQDDDTGAQGVPEDAVFARRPREVVLAAPENGSSASAAATAATTAQFSAQGGLVKEDL